MPENTVTSPLLRVGWAESANLDLLLESGLCKPPQTVAPWTRRWPVLVSQLAVNPSASPATSVDLF